MPVDLDGPRLAPRSEDRRVSSSSSCTATAPTAMTSSGSAASGRPLARCRLRLAACAGAVRAGAGRAAVVRITFARSRRALARRQQPRRRARALSRRGTCAPGLTTIALALVGFSQGTMMALHVGLRRAVRPAAIVGYSGMLVMPGDAGAPSIAAEIKRGRRSCSIHGDQDQVIPVQALFLAAKALAALEVPVEWHLSSGVGHGIDPEGLRHGGAFLAARFRGARTLTAGIAASQRRHRLPVQL